MKAAIFSSTHTAPQSFLHVEDVPRPQLEAGHLLLRVVACGVCRTDLHIVEGDLPPLRPRLTPGHQIVGEVIEGATLELPAGTRVGISWMGGVDGDCPYCRRGMENLCDKPTFTGYAVDGGYAEYVLVRAVSKCVGVPEGVEANPLLKSSLPHAGRPYRRQMVSGQSGCLPFIVGDANTREVQQARSFAEHDFISASPADAGRNRSGSRVALVHRRVGGTCGFGCAVRDF
ncbi:MAG: alcohol dehydrogenase catalytic domain-containing protein [Terriglobales bacterium]|jgi:hypothetical protein